MSGRILWKLALMLVAVTAMVAMSGCSLHKERPVVGDNASAKQMPTIMLSVANAAKRDHVIAVQRRRVELAGFKDVEITAEGDKGIKVSAPSGLAGLKDLLLSTSTLEFYAEAPESVYQKYDAACKVAHGAKVDPPVGFRVERGKYPDGQPIMGLNGANYLLLYKDVQFQASDFVDFRLTTDANGKAAVGFSLAVSSAPRFAALTTSLINEKEYGREHGKLAIFVNGALESAPSVRSVISDCGIITLGVADPAELQNKTKNLLIALQSGALDTPVTFESETPSP